MMSKGYVVIFMSVTLSPALFVQLKDYFLKNHIVFPSRLSQSPAGCVLFSY